VSGPAIASELQVTVGSEVTFAFHVTNHAAKKVELTFPSGQTHDVVVLDSAGHEVWRWSEDRMFTQAIQNTVLEANETLTYEAAWKPSQAHGKYVAVASLSGDQAFQQRVEFVIP
jgi:hypothetical protein